MAAAWGDVELRHLIQQAARPSEILETDEGRGTRTP